MLDRSFLAVYPRQIDMLQYGCIEAAPVQAKATAACLTNSLRVCGTRPILGEVDPMPAHNDG